MVNISCYFFIHQNYYCLYTCIEPSYIINKTYINSYKNNFTLKFSTLLNKTSLEYLNLKYINLIFELFKYSESINICDIGLLIQLYESEVKLKYPNIDINKILKFINSNHIEL